VDAVIAPAFPSNTARAGVLYPLVVGLAEAGGATPDKPDRRRLGGYLMFSGMASLSVSSALWLTAMVANPLGAELARGSGVQISFVSWLIASSVPTLAAMAAVAADSAASHVKPEVTATPARSRDGPARTGGAWSALAPRMDRVDYVCRHGRHCGPPRHSSAWTPRPLRFWAWASCWHPVC
jgi:DASS family divalent anion:Na+ symporter